MRMLPRFGLSILVAAVVLAGVLGQIADAQSTSPAAATSPALDPKAVAAAVLHGVSEGDDKAVFELLYFSTPAERDQARAKLGEILALGKLQSAINKTFADKATPVPGVPSAESLEPELKQIAEAQVTTAGEKATLSEANGHHMFFFLVAGQWKVDLAATGPLGPPLPPDELAGAAARAKAIRTLADDVLAKKFPDAGAVLTELDKRGKQGAGTPQADKARINATRVTMANLREALMTCEVDTDRFPTTAEGLNALVVPPPGLQGWHQYLEKLPLDGWGHPFIYRFPGTQNPQTFDLISPGPDGKVGTPDDIVLSQ